MSYKSLFSACLAGFFFSSLVHTLTPFSRETTDDSVQVAARWSSQICGLLTSAQEAPVGGEQNPVFPHQEVCLVNFSPLLHEKNILQGIDNPF